MLNPAHFFGVRSNNASQQPNKTNIPIAIDKIADNETKSKWDQQLIIPTILYTKFNVPVPAGQKKKQTNSYPPSLIDYIRRAYSKCEDESQKKAMENELRHIVSNFQENLNQVSWQTYPLPHIAPTAFRQKPKERIVSNQVNYIKKGQIRLPSSYKISDEDKPSKAMLLAQKKLQKLEEKFKNQEKEGKPEDKSEQKFFIGFRNELEAPKITAPPITPKFPPPTEKNIRNPNIHKKVEQKIEYQISKQNSKSNNSRPKQTKRQKQPKKITKKQLEMVVKSKQNGQKINTVAKRFAEFNKLKSDNYQKHQISSNQENSVCDQTIVGKSKSIEKPYLRITGRPNPETVRPEPVLKKALKYFLDAYTKGCNYEYLIGQLRSLRQDLTVQNIKNSFTVQVYEQNFKISLFQNDAAQFKHLQTGIWQLYSQGLLYTKESRVKFISYQMMTLALEGKNQNLEFMLTRLPPNTLEEQEIQNSLKLRSMLSLGNYRGFFDFYSECDHITRCLLNHYIDKIRMKCLVMLCKTCGEKISLKNIAKFISQDQDVLQALINAEGGILENGFLILKPSYEKFINSEHLASKKTSVLLD